MSAFIFLSFLAIGVIAGVLAGVIGIGGGIVVIPALVLVAGFSQHLAQGTSLAMMLPPIGILAVLAYARAGFVDWKAAALLCAGFLAGSIFGARIALSLPTGVITRVFGGVLVLMGLRFIWKG